MSVASEISEVSYTGNNSIVTGYLITFEYLEASHIKVSARSAADVVTILGAADYEVDTSSDEVTTTSPWANTYTITIYRELPITQPTEYTQYGPFPAATTEQALDWRTHVDQQLGRTLGRTVRAPWALDEIQPEANGLMGFDALGEPHTYDQDEVRELAQLAGGDDGMGTRTFADATARGAAVPDFLGQWGVQRDNGSTWIATALSAGSWVAAPGNSNLFTLVTTDAQLQAACLVGGRIGVYGAITLAGSTTATTGVLMSVAGTEIFGIRDASGNRGKLTFAHSNGIDRIIIDIRAVNCTVRDLELTMNHPLSTHQHDQDTAINLYGDPVDASGFVIEDNDIHDVAVGIYNRAGGTTTPRPGRIRNNTIRSFCGTGMYIDWNLDHVLVDNNTVIGRELGAVASVTGVAATNVLTWVAGAHGLVVGQGVAFQSITSGGAGIVAQAEDYYVLTTPAANTFTLGYTPGGTTLDFTTDVAAVVRARETHSTIYASAFAVTGDAATDVFTATAHGLLSSSRIWFTSLTGGTGLSTYTLYYVLAAGLGANSFQVANSLANWALDVPVLFSADLTAATAVILGPTGHGNAIFIGNGANYCAITNNKLSHVDRHGIEVYGGAPMGTRSARIMGNVCEDCQYGISLSGFRSMVVIGNQIERAKNIGLELVGELGHTYSGFTAADLARYTVVGNSINDTRYTNDVVVSSLAISVDSVVTPCLIASNQIGKVTSKPSLAAVSVAIQIYRGSGVVNDITIRGNSFTDAGSYGVYANPGGGGARTRYIIEGNTFLYSTLYDGLYGSESVWPAVAINGVVLSVVRNNTVFFAAAALKAFGTFSLSGTCTIYTGDSTMSPETAAGTFLGTNLRIEY